MGRRAFSKVWLACAVIASIGLGSGARAQEQGLASLLEAQPPPAGGSRITGQVKDRFGTLVVIVLRNGFTIRADFTRAIQDDKAVAANPGMFVQIDGVLTKTGMMAAYVVRRAKPNQASWVPDQG